MIPYGRQSISKSDVDAVVEVLRSEFLTQGPKVPEFEKAVADYVKADYAVAVNSATSALHIACLALGLGPGDRLWTSPITFVASANCALYCGAEVDFVDIDPETLNLCPVKLEQKLESASKKGELPKIIIPVHMCGHPCDMEKIDKLAKRYGIRVIEDASHAIGATYKGKRIGSCSHSDITVFSFHPVKIITSGEGGMAVTNDSELARRMELLRNHGVTRNIEEMQEKPEGPWYYEQIDLGFNYRMTDLQAALGLSQLSRLNGFVQKRNELAVRYERLLDHLPIRTPSQPIDGISAFHLYVIQLNDPSKRKKVFEALRASGVGVNVHYIPVYRQPFYRKMGYSSNYCSAAEKYYSRAITLPLYPEMTDEEQHYVTKSLEQALNKL